MPETPTREPIISEQEAREAKGRFRERARSKAEDLRGRASSATDRAMSGVGGRMERAGQGLRDRAPDEGRIHGAAEAVAGRFESAGHYLQDRDFEALSEDMADAVRRHPLRSVLIGAGAGFLLGRLLSRRRR